MKVAILEDYQRAAPALECFGRLAAHEVEVFSDPVRNEDAIAARLAPFEAVVLIRERTRITASLLEKLPRLKLVVQTAKIGPHVDVAACKARGITVCDSTGNPVSTAELTWGLMLAAARNLVSEVERARQGEWQGSVGYSLAGKRRHTDHRLRPSEGQRCGARLHRPGSSDRNRSRRQGELLRSRSHT